MQVEDTDTGASGAGGEMGRFLSGCLHSSVRHSVRSPAGQQPGGGDVLWRSEVRARESAT